MYQMPWYQDVIGKKVVDLLKPKQNKHNKNCKTRDSTECCFSHCIQKLMSDRQRRSVGVSDVQATTVNTVAMTMILFSSHTETHTVHSGEFTFICHQASRTDRHPATAQFQRTSGMLQKTLLVSTRIINLLRKFTVSCQEDATTNT